MKFVPQAVVFTRGKDLAGRRDDVVPSSALTLPLSWTAPGVAAGPAVLVG